ncbi:MAG: 4'-phosphopantetheinyl transferase family protein [Streptosporangiaceae bacterium]
MLGANDCQVWWAALDRGAPWHEPLLDPTERQRRGQYRSIAERDRFTLGVALSRLVLGRQVQTAPGKVAIDRTCPRCGRPHGRPRLVIGGELDFSVSHSGELVAVAVTRSSAGAGAGRRGVGVDVERVTSLNEPRLWRAVLSPAERDTFVRLGAAEQASSFFRYWVRKESVLKATGHGLSVPPTRLTVSDSGRPARLLGWAGRPFFPSTVTMCDLSAPPGYAAALTLVGPGATVREWDASGLLSGV